MPDNLSETDIFALLARRRRRLILRILQDSPASMTPRALAERIQECESTPDGDLRDITVSLAHVHLPKLDEAQVIRYDHEGKTVSPGPNFAVLTGVLADVDERHETWEAQ